MLDLVIATRNSHKARELRGLLRVRGVRWRTPEDVPRVGEVRETGRTFEVNASRKARAVARATGLMALADDSGLEVEVLRGAPGVRSARFAGRHGNDAANNRKLLRLLAGRAGAARRARYVCVLALADPFGRVTITRGTWTGRIALRPRGANGFGYDPIFELPRRRKTVGQLPARTKQRLSHRAAAARGMRRVVTRYARRAGLTGASQAAPAGGRRVRG